MTVSATQNRPTLKDQFDNLWPIEGTRSKLSRALVGLSIVFGVLGLIPVNAGVVGFAILLALLARIVQANAHHEALIRELRRR